MCDYCKVFDNGEFDYDGTSPIIDDDKTTYKYEINHNRNDDAPLSVKAVIEDTFTISARFNGELGELCFLITSDCTDEHMELLLLYGKEVKINYCPMCGRRLSE